MYREGGIDKSRLCVHRYQLFRGQNESERDFVTVKKNVSKVFVIDLRSWIWDSTWLARKTWGGFVQAITLKTDGATRRTAQDG